MTTVTVEQTKRRFAVEGTGLAFLGIVLIALNLRPAITSLGALLEEVQADLHLSGSITGLVTSMPVICFALFGFVTPWLARRFGPHRVLSTSVVLLAVGLLARALAGSAVVFFVTSALALAGIACANVLLPSIVKEHFPNRIGLVTGIYTMTLMLGASLATAMSVPVSHALGGWHAGLAVWAVVASVAVLPWIPLGGRDRGRKSAKAAKSDIRPARTSIGWALAIFFGTQSLTAYVIMGWLPRLYRDAGFSAETAGLLVAGVMVLGVPMSLLVPAIASKVSDPRVIMFIVNACCALGFVGLLVAPIGGALLWTLLLGIGQGAFPLALTMIGMRTRTAAGTVALSAFAQSAGYLIAATGPLLVGMLYTQTHAWVLPILFLVVVVMIQSIAGIVAGRPRFVEDVCITH